MTYLDKYNAYHQMGTPLANSLEMALIAKARQVVEDELSSPGSRELARFAYSSAPAALRWVLGLCASVGMSDGSTDAELDAFLDQYWSTLVRLRSGV